MSWADLCLILPILSKRAFSETKQTAKQCFWPDSLFSFSPTPRSRLPWTHHGGGEAR